MVSKGDISKVRLFYLPRIFNSVTNMFVASIFILFFQVSLTGGRGGGLGKNLVM